MSCFIASNLNLCEKYCRNRASQRADVSPVEATLATIAAESRPNRSHRSSRPADSPEIPYKYVDLFCEESTLRLVYSIDVIMSMEMAGRSPPFGPRIITLGLWPWPVIARLDRLSWMRGSEPHRGLLDLCRRQFAFNNMFKRYA